MATQNSHEPHCRAAGLKIAPAPLTPTNPEILLRTKPSHQGVRVIHDMRQPSMKPETHASYDLLQDPLTNL